MSNHWNLHCRSCDLTHDLGWNNAGEEIQSLIGLLPELAAIAPVMDRLQDYWRFNLEFPFGLLDFAGRHHSHDLIAVDEYGQFFDACGQHYKCPCCNHSSYCKLPLNHDGGHGQLPKGDAR
ncbi:hypothetical protein [Nocardia wallacei]|uniref:hypothetical protein n=1 Tax=Nocardia wallacei TaxID=480035 RepID=UPI00245892AF|nr:hypothetical protein [Nocardia wallacei]